MTSISVSLPTSVKEFVDARVAEGGYRDSGDYVLALIEQDRQRGVQHPSQTHDAVWAQVRAGAEQLSRGEIAAFDDRVQILDDIERRGRERMDKANGK